MSVHGIFTFGKLIFLLTLRFTDGGSGQVSIMEKRFDNKKTV